MWGALAVVGSAVLAADGSWKSNVVRLPLKRRKPSTVNSSQVVALTTDGHSAAEPSKYDHADSQSLVLRRFSDLKDYIEEEQALAAK